MKLIGSIAILIISFGIGLSQTKENALDMSDNPIPVNTLDRNTLLPFNEICPVEGKEINENVTQVIYENQLIGFCCEGCDEAFLKNPKAFEDNLRREDK